MSEYSRSDLASCPIDKIEETVNFELRHKPGIRPCEYLKEFLDVSRQYAYATQDDSWGELEKHLTIIFRNYEQGRREITQLRQQLAEAKSTATYDDACNEIMMGFQSLCNAMNINIERYEEDQATASCINDGLEDIAAKIVNAQPEAGEAVAWWNGGGSVTTHKDRPEKHYWGKVMPLYTHLALAVPEGLLNLLNAVGHVGVDFGYGPYELCAEEIEKARDLYAQLSAAQEKGGD